MSRPYAVLVLGILGFVLVSTFTVSVVLGQAYMPRNPGMASGMIVGFAIGAGGLGATALGGIADRWGLASALWISAVMPLRRLRGRAVPPGTPREVALARCRRHGSDRPLRGQ